MTHKIHRQPVRHFFVKRSLQYRIVSQIVVMVLVTAVLTTAALTFVFINKSQHGMFYYVSSDSRQDLELKNIFEVVFPSVIGAEAFSVLIGIGIGLFSSRKIAVPLYKFEKWVAQLKNGKLNTTLSFRENEEMNDITVECNELAQYYRDVFLKIKTSLEAIEKEAAGNPAAQEQVKEIKAVLDKMDFS